jgi:hypothetical protein
MVSWFGSQNQVGFGLSVAPQNRQMEVGTVHTSRSSDLLCMEASLVMVFQSGLKTGRGVMAGAARGTINVTGCVESYYPCFIVFILLGHKRHYSHLVFCLSL